MTIVQGRRLVSVSEWDREWSHDDDVRELVKGLPSMAPSENIDNLNGAFRLAMVLRDQFGDRYRFGPGLEMLVQDDPVPTIRRPDLVVVDASVRHTYRVTASQALFVAEFLSPSTHLTDVREKVSEYGASGIPAYLIVDLRTPGAETLTLHTDPRDTGYGHTHEGRRVGVELPAGSVTVDVADLV